MFTSMLRVWVGAGLSSCGLGPSDLQKPVVTMGLDGFGVNVLGQADAPHDTATGALEPVETLSRALLLPLSAPLEGEHVVRDGGGHVLELHARKLNLQDERPVVSTDVDAGRGRGTLRRP